MKLFEIIFKVIGQIVFRISGGFDISEANSTDIWDDMKGE